MTFAQDATNRTEDINGFVEIKGNPISKVGVFPYLGKQISDDLIPDKIYQVYRPKEELASVDCIESFKLQPIIDEHTMLGTEPGMTPAEKKGVHGVLGEEIFFDENDGEGVLKGNIKIFSQSLLETIDTIKKDISLGYRCVYEITSGIFAGVKYDVIQKNIRGNHLAIVHEGRMGRDIAVLDHADTMKFTVDSKELFTMALAKVQAQIKFAQDALAETKALELKMKEAKDEGGLADLAAKIETITSLLEELKSMEEKEAAKEAKETGGEEEVASVDEDTEKDKEGVDEDEDKKEGMDAAAVSQMIVASQKGFMKSIAKRDALVNKLKAHIGTFDHAPMTLNQVAVYAADKLNLKPVKGHELTAVETYLSVKNPSTPFAHVTDSATAGKVSPIRKHINQ